MATLEEMYAAGIRIVEVEPRLSVELYFDGAWRQAWLQQWQRAPDGGWHGYVSCPEAELGTSARWYVAQRIRPTEDQSPCTYRYLVPRAFIRRGGRW